MIRQGGEEITDLIHEVCMKTPSIAPRMPDIGTTRRGLLTADLFGIWKAGKLIGGIILRGNEIHIAILPEWHRKWFDRSCYQFLNEQYKVRGPLMAVAHNSNTTAQHFIRRLARTSRRSGDYLIYELAPPWGRS